MIVKVVIRTLSDGEAKVKGCIPVSVSHSLTLSLSVSLFLCLLISLSLFDIDFQDVRSDSDSEHEGDPVLKSDKKKLVKRKERSSKEDTDSDEAIKNDQTRRRKPRRE